MKDAGRCVLFSSHIMQEVAALCDHIVVIANGRDVASGSTETLCQIAGQADLEDAFVNLVGGEQ